MRRTFPELYKSHIVKLFEEFPTLRSCYNQQNKELVLPNGSRLFFGSAEHESDMASFYSAEFADILVDEAQEFSEGEMQRLSGSNRCTSNRDIVPKMVYTFMPGLSESGMPPKGLPFLKRKFIDTPNPAFVQAFSWDNIEWARKELERDGVTEEEFYGWSNEERREYFVARTEYGAKLAGITNKALRDAWLYGDWGVFEGQYFTNFDTARHTASPSEIADHLKPWHKYWISGDWGYEHPACIHWHAMDESGRIFTDIELWGREMGEIGIAQGIVRLTPAGRKLSSFPFSWDAFGKLNKTTRKSITEMIAHALPAGFPKPSPADASPGQRISGWRLMYQLLDADMWVISQNCEKLIECIPTLVRDMESNPEDVLKVDYSENSIGDDPADCARYGLQAMLGAAQKPMSVMRAEKLKDVAASYLPKPQVVKGDFFHRFGGKSYS